MLFFLLTLIIERGVSQSSGQWVRIPSPGDVQRVYVASDSTLFVCTNTGLYEENLRTGAWGFYSSANSPLGNNVYDVAQGADATFYFASFPVTTLKNGTFSSIPFDSIPYAYDILVDRMGRLWGSTSSAVYQDAPNGWTQFIYGIGEGNHLVVAEDSAANIWCGADGSLSYYDTLGWHMVEFYQLLGPGGNVTSITAAEDSSIWFGTSTWCLGHQPHGGQLIGWTNLVAAPPTGIAVRHDTVWVAANGLFRGIGNSWTQLATSDGLADSIAVSAAFDRWGQLWIGHRSGRLSIQEKGGWKTKSLHSSLPDYHCSSVAAAPDGLLAIATENNGISIFDGSSWQTIRSGLPSDTITVLRYDHEGNLWAGTPSGIGMYDGKAWKIYTTSDGLLSNEIVALAISKDDTVWCVAGTSLAHFDGASWKSKLIPANTGVQRLRDLAIDSSGRVWAAADSGILRFDGVAFQHYFPLTKHSGMNSIAIGFNDVKWCGSDSAGGWQFNDTSWTPLDWMNAGPAPVTSIRVGRDGSVWIGSSSSEGNIYRFNGNAWSHFSETDGLSGGPINDFAFDARGNVWIAAEMGTTVYNANGVAISSIPPRQQQIPIVADLRQNYPNPFNPATRIEFTLAEQSYVVIDVYNILGQLVRTIVRQWLVPGKYAMEFDGVGLPSGVYLYRMSASGNAARYVQSKKMILIR